MRLADLDPMWLEADGREKMGILFQCPACRDQNRGHGAGHYIAAYFKNPLDGGPPATPEHEPKPRWVRNGDTFETLSLSPSIAMVNPECWHGYVTSGEAT